MRVCVCACVRACGGGAKANRGQRKQSPCRTSITVEELVGVAVEVVNERLALRATRGATDVKGRQSSSLIILGKEHTIVITHVAHNLILYGPFGEGLGDCC